MKRLLVTGLKDPAGGVESAAMGYIRQFDHSELQVDVAVVGEAFSCSSEIESYGGQVWYLPSRVKDPVGYTKAISAIFKTVRYDAVWCHVSGLTNIDFLKEAQKAGVPTRVVHAHTSAFAWGNPVMRYVVPVLHRHNQKKLQNYATHLWACSEAAARFMYGDECIKAVSVIANAVDVEAFRFSPDVRARQRGVYGYTDEPVVLHVGRMCTAKNQCFLLDVFCAVLQKCPQARLLFVGDGELEQEVRAYADRIQVSHAVEFTGAVNGTRDVMQVGDVFLLPSLTEGMPVTVMEAQAAGLPCVVSAEAVPRCANVTDSIEFVSLEDSVEVWAERVLQQCGKRVLQGAEMMRVAGLDTAEAARNIQAFFTAKTVGMVTFPRAANYGTALQAIALQTAMEKHGAMAYFVDHICKKIVSADKLLDWKRIWNPKYTIAHLLNFSTARKRLARFASFAKTYMRFGSESQTADIWVAGSDQIWNGEITGNDDFYFLDFDKQNGKKTAYAASFGVTEIPKDRYPGLKELLSDFDLLTVRETSAADIIEDVVGKAVEVVSDPTLLLSATEWEKYMGAPQTREYIFVYTVFNSDRLWEFAEELSRRTGLPIKTVSYSVLHKHQAEYDYTAGPSEWLRYLADAAYVVTNSFHGVAFSVNFEKQFFYELPPVSSGVGSRLAHIAAHYGVSHRAIDVADVNKTIEYAPIKEQLQADRDHAQTCIQAILNL